LLHSKPPFFLLLRKHTMTTEAAYNALFICTGNSARSILAEGILNKLGQGRFRAYSAGSQPKGEVHPLALATLERLHMPTTGYRSKSWDEFVAPGAPVFDFIFTVCDNAAGEACPLRHSVRAWASCSSSCATASCVE
jgi:protein-tyrosine-phosphatase